MIVVMAGVVGFLEPGREINKTQTGTDNKTKSRSYKTGDLSPFDWSKYNQDNNIAGS